MSSSQWMIAWKVPSWRAASQPPQSGWSTLTSMPRPSLSSSAMSACSVFQSLQPAGTEIENVTA